MLSTFIDDQIKVAAELAKKNVANSGTWKARELKAVLVFKLQDDSVPPKNAVMPIPVVIVTDMNTDKPSVGVDVTPMNPQIIQGLMQG